MFKITILMTISFLLLGCLRQDVELTTQYVVNENWDKEFNSITIARLKLKKDSSMRSLPAVTVTELLNKLIIDSSFYYVANVKYNGQDYSKRKVYFDDDNGFFWYTIDGESRKEKIGELEKNRWYWLAGVYINKTSIYIYVDSANQVHRFEVNQQNY